MVTHLEVCIDNIESLHYAIAGGATRIELCSSLALGGLTPSYGFMQQAAKQSSVPVYAMIRPRQGDFFYNEEELDMMRWDIEAAHQSGLDGVVLGVLTQEGDIHMPFATALCEFAQALGLGITFHRAFDQCRNAEQALEDIIHLGCERILTSGLAPSAPAGESVLKSLVEQAQGRIAIMAGAGVNADNVRHLVKNTNVQEVHLSGKTTRSSQMTFIAEQSKMGASDVDDFAIPITSTQAIANVAAALK
ncbi:copper homeostasis protein CutC [Vibrio parahaemolyticus]|uniref:copper homeostasis protein CutC n=1 Tax=Vibrio parahaemolyticus TaxID=670 RepID=UPI00111E06D0|nr:copper homeostasis protein CutC [Vibrio parahaemolyticus]TOF06601.1 copper homeostasis protein CutC [Vibrio parahaemolyticus]